MTSGTFQVANRHYFSHDLEEEIYSGHLWPHCALIQFNKNMTISSLHILVNHNCQSWCILISKCKVAINTKNQMMKPWEYHQFTWEVFNHRRSLIRPQLEVPKNCQWSENIPINNPMHCSDLSQGNVLMWMYLIFTLSRFLIQMLWGIS